MRPNPTPGIFGHNRTMVMPHDAVLPPEGILESRLPGFQDTLVRFHTSPSMGARFAQAPLEIAPGGGTTRPIEDGLEHVLYACPARWRFAPGTHFTFDRKNKGWVRHERKVSGRSC